MVFYVFYKQIGMQLEDTYMYEFLKPYNCVASLQKGPHVAKIKNEICIDLCRAGHDKSVEKIISVLAQIFKKLWSIYELHNYIILIIILDIII